MIKKDDINIELLEQLSKIKCTKQEEKDLLIGIKEILDYADQLDELDTKDVPACNFVLQDFQNNVFREDQPEEEMTTEQLLSNAPDHISQMIKVPKILKN